MSRRFGAALLSVVVLLELSSCGGARPSLDEARYRMRVTLAPGKELSVRFFAFVKTYTAGDTLVLDLDEGKIVIDGHASACANVTTMRDLRTSTLGNVPFVLDTVRARLSTTLPLSREDTLLVWHEAAEAWEREIEKLTHTMSLFYQSQLAAGLEWEKAAALVAERVGESPLVAWVGKAARGGGPDDLVIDVRFVGFEASWGFGLRGKPTRGLPPIKTGVSRMAPETLQRYLESVRQLGVDDGETEKVSLGHRGYFHCRGGGCLDQPSFEDAA